MVRMTRQRTAKSQLGYQTTFNGVYTEGAGDINFAAGQLILVRMPTVIPRKASIISATLKFNLVVKNAGTTQNSSHRIWGEGSGDSPVLTPGRDEWSGRPPGTANYVNWNCAWTANEQQTTPDNLVYRTVNVVNIVSELVFRDDWVPGGYITFQILCDNENGSDMGIRANNDFLPTIVFDVEYEESLLDERSTINMCENSQFDLRGETVNGSPTDQPTAFRYWTQNPIYGAYVDPANQGTLVRDTNVTRVPGIPTMRFTTGTPPAENNKRTGPLYAINENVDYHSIFAGWIFIPSSVPANFDIRAMDVYNGGSTPLITARDTWVPFCTNPIRIAGGNYATWWYTMSFGINWQAGWQFWLSEPTILRSSFRQMPFNGLTPDRDPGILHTPSVSNQQSNRVWTPKRNLKLDGVFTRAYPSWIKRADGIMQLAEPVKGGPTMANMPSTQIQNYDPNKRIAEY